MRTASCHPEVKHFAKGKCRNCYMLDFKREHPEYREYMRLYLKQWRANQHPDVLREYSRLKRERAKARGTLSLYSKRASLKRKYGLSQIDVERMLLKQRGQCAICETEISFTTLAIDHCHSTGKVRGALCPPCNSALGFFRDNEQYLRKAILYLAGSKAKDETLSEIAKQP